MKEGTKNIIAACIIATGIVIAAYLYALSNRYEIDRRYPAQRFDKWKNTKEFMIEK